MPTVRIMSPFILLLFFIMMLVESSRSYLLSRSYRFRSSFIHQHFATENEDEYYFTNGQETLIDQLSTLRPLLATELELTFDHVPSLKKLAQAKQWPPRESSSTSQQTIDHALAWNEKSHTEEDVKNVLGKFRKTILGLEKYRINNPGRVATLYCEMLKICLSVPDCWGAAANALEYAGLVFRDHVIERPRNNTFTEISHPILDVNSLWTTACMRLLDIDLTTQTTTLSSSKSMVDATSTNAPSSSNNNNNNNNNNNRRPIDDQSVTWDQKFFSQIEMNDEARMAIQDMMLCIVRVAVRLLLAREADIAMDGTTPDNNAITNTQGPLGMVDVLIDDYRCHDQLPPPSSVKVLLALDFKLLQEIGLDDEEDLPEILITHLTQNKENVFVDVDEMSILRCCDRFCSAYPILPNHNIFHDFVDANDPNEEEEEVVE